MTDKPPGEQSEAFHMAVRLLAQRNHTRAELHRKLRQRSVSADTIGAVLDTCERLDYLNDTRTAVHYAEELQRKGYGPRYIRFSLKKKGVNPDRIASRLTGLDDDTAELESALALFEKKRIRFSREPEGRKRRDKIYRFLYARGFSPHVIGEVIRRAGEMP